MLDAGGTVVVVSKRCTKLKHKQGDRMRGECDQGLAASGWDTLPSPTIGMKGAGETL